MMKTRDIQLKHEPSPMKEEILDFTSNMTPANDSLETGKALHKILKQEICPDGQPSLNSLTEPPDLETQSSAIQNHSLHHKYVTISLVPTILDDIDPQIKKEPQDETDDLDNILHCSVEVKHEPSLLSSGSEGVSEENWKVQNYLGGDGGKNSNVEHMKLLNAFVKLVDLFPPHIRETGRAHTNSVQCLCIYCKREAKRRNRSTKEHIQKNICKNPFICSHSSASLDHRCHLNQHMRTHTGAKPFRCSHCSASFARKANLIIHTRTHTGEKPFRCSHCSASFSDKSSLNSHTRTHTGEKPFSCSHCSARFAQKGNVRAHMRTQIAVNIL